MQEANRTRQFGVGAVGCALGVAFALSACTTGAIGGDHSGSPPGLASGGATSGNPASGGGAVPVSGSGSPSGSASAGGGSLADQPLKPFSPASAALHRLTKTQFQNSLSALLGTVTIAALEDDSYIGGFATVGAGSVVTSSDGVQKYQVAIDAALDQVFADTTRRSQLVGCTPKTPLDSACAQTFVKTFGRLAWRRPLTPAQLDRYAKLATDSAVALADPYAGLRWAASALLQSPYFLYRSERGAPVAGFADRNKYTPYELASKLAFFLWNSTPDAALLDSADSGELSSVAGYAAQAARLLAAPQGHQAIVNFAREFMRTDNLSGMPKDGTTYPAFTDTLAAAMGTEVLTLWENTAFAGDQNALSLFTTQNTYLNKELGALYGVDTSGLSESAFSPVTLPPGQGRSGLLTSAALLSLQSTQIEGSPTLRGRFIREQFLCLTIPEPPPNVVTTLTDPPAGVTYTKRQKMINHEASPDCAACHGFMDPLGFSLEHFDAVGAYRATDSGLPIDTTGKLDDQAFADSVALGGLLAASPKTAPCLVRNIYSYAAGHAIPDSEEVVVRDLAAGFTTAGNHLRSLILDIVNSDGFNFVSPESP